MMVTVDIEAEYRAHLADLLRYATALVGPDDAGDVVNEAVGATWRRGSLEGVDDVRAYWFRAVSNTANRWHRSRSRRTSREQRWSERPAVVADGVADDARRTLACLTVQQRCVVYLTYWHDWDPARIAEAMGVSEGTVRKQLARARDRLREVLDHDR